MPTPLASVIAGLLLLATLAQRGDAGWLSVLLGPSAAGSSARGIIAWTVLAPLALALLALAGVRHGLYDLNFAFALLAATMCCGLTALVLWNAARVERAQARATSARDAMQLAANRLRLARSATGIQMWEWLPATRDWYSIDGAERLDPSTNEYLEAGLARTLRDGKSEFEFPVQRAACDDHRAKSAGCWPPAGASSATSESVVVGITVDITERKRAAHRARGQRDAAATRGARAARLRLRLELRERQDRAHLRHRTDAGLPGRGNFAGEPLVGRPGASGRSRRWHCPRAWRARPVPTVTREHRLRIPRAPQQRQLRLDLGSLRAGARSRRRA